MSYLGCYTEKPEDAERFTVEQNARLAEARKALRSIAKAMADKIDNALVGMLAKEKP